MQDYYIQMKKHLLSNLEQCERLGPKKIELKKDEYRQVKLILEAKLLEYNNL